MYHVQLQWLWRGGRTSHGLDVSPSQDLSTFGMAWIRIRAHSRSIYICIYYIPPSHACMGSTYFLNEDRTVFESANSQFETLTHQCCLKYFGLGEVLITCDLSSRTGTLDDRASTF